MSLLSQKTDEERDDLKTSRTGVGVAGEYSSLQSACTLLRDNLSQTVDNRLLTRGEETPRA